MKREKTQTRKQNIPSVPVDSTTIDNKVVVKFFLGVPVTSEIKMHLKQSQEWANVEKLITFEKDDLTQIHYQKKDYIGYYSETDELPINELKLANDRIRKKLQQYCPMLNVEKYFITLIPQIFIS